MKRWIIVGGLIALLIIALPFVLPGPSDKELISQALKESIKAGREGRAGSVLDLLSSSFTVNDQQYGSRRNIAKFIKDAKPDLEISNSEPVIQGDTATIDSPAKISLTFPAYSVALKSLHLEFAKELGTRFLIFPTRDWKLVKVTVPEEVVNEVTSQFPSE